MTRRHQACRKDTIAKAEAPIRTEWDDAGAAISRLRSQLEYLEAWFPDMSVDFTITFTRKGRKE